MTTHQTQRPMSRQPVHTNPTQRRPLHLPTRALILVLLVFATVIAACRCSFSIAMQCADETIVFGFDGAHNYGFMDCANAVDLACPEAAYGDPAAAAAEAACVEQAIAAWSHSQALPTPGGYPSNTAFDNPFDNAGTNNIVAPQNPVSIDCTPFRLLAPTDGLANGLNTFIWDPPLPLTGLHYRLLFFAENGQLLFTFSSPTTGFAQPDISQQVIGGAFQITVRIEAFNGAGTVVCTTDRVYLREAPNLGQPQQAAPPPTETPIPPPR
ncbi:MAG: hypothetical protein U0670_11800 [Anaerolineae bacterium]